MKSYENVELRSTEPIIYPTINKGVFSDSFEFYPDFVLDFPPWTQFDGDGSSTWGMEGYEWPNVYYEGSFMIFNPSETTPPLSNHPPHTGEKYASCWDAVTPPNDDWLFSPQFHVDEDGMLSFWGRSLNNAYGLEEIEYGISTTDTDPSSFTIVSGPVIEVPTVGSATFTTARRVKMALMAKASAPRMASSTGVIMKAPFYHIDTRLIVPLRH